MGANSSHHEPLGDYQRGTTPALGSYTAAHARVSLRKSLRKKKRDKLEHRDEQNKENQREEVGGEGREAPAHPKLPTLPTPKSGPAPNTPVHLDLSVFLRGLETHRGHGGKQTGQGEHKELPILHAPSPSRGPPRHTLGQKRRSSLRLSLQHDGAQEPSDSDVGGRAANDVTPPPLLPTPLQLPQDPSPQAPRDAQLRSREDASLSMDTAETTEMIRPGGSPVTSP
ncbi:hypothetical protein GWK47_022521 [Chionoecetes opilio]|uniref:Uncharacterized protein n=1 Tax=Chionoecetes opilio TaxID=41210 RepID=A0A8J4XN58_CHIOP|nr:hypothetical protein GWK47_022521 [Chionoecetes opilio]